MSLTLRQWRVPTGVVTAKALITLVLAGVTALRASDGGLVFLAGVAALGAAVLTARDLLAPIRLAADTEGVTVITGIRTPTRIPWSDVERMRVDVRHRYGRRSELLEIDTGDGLHLFSRYDLGVTPEEALEDLRQIRGC
jgi:hypothetical protein